MENSVLPIGKITKVRIIAVVGAIGLLALTANIILAALTGAVALGAIGVVGIVGIGAAQSLPLLAQKWENKLLSLRKAEARENPHEQMDNEYIRRETILAEEEKALTAAGAELKSLKGQLDSQLKANPEFDLTEEYGDLESMRVDYEERLTLLKGAKEELVEFKSYIAFKKSKHQFALASNAVRDKLALSSKEQATNNLLFKEADGEIDRQYNRSFAAMEVARATRLNRNTPKSLGNSPSPTLANQTNVIDMPEVVTIKKG